MDSIAIRVNDELASPGRCEKRSHKTFFPLKWRLIVELHLCGRTAREIAQATGYSEPYVGVVLRRPEAVAWKQQVMNVYQQEFEALFPQVVRNLRQQLNANDVQTQMEAQNQWLRASGKYNQRENSKVVNNVTAEEVVFQILNGDVEAKE